MPKHSLGPDQLHQLLVKHNRLSTLLSIVLIPISLFCWWLSYLFATGIVSFFYRRILGEAAPVSLVTGCGIGFLIILLVEGLWHAREAFDLIAYQKSDFSLGKTPQGMFIGSYQHPAAQFEAALHIAWIVAEVVLFAPHSLLRSLHHWQARVKIDPALLAPAVQLYDHLSRQKDWTPQSELRGHKTALRYLNAAGLLWTRQEGKYIAFQALPYES